MKRVVITGYGVISSSGNDVDTLWNRVKKGISGIKKITDPEFSEINCRIAGYIEDFEANKYLENKEIKQFDLYTQYACAATKQALELAGVTDDNFNKDRVGVYIGSGIGGIDTILKNHGVFLKTGSKRVSPFMIPMMISNIASGIVAIKTGFRGPSFSPVAACATANQAIGEAFLNIRHGYTDAIIAGGAESSINVLSFSGFSNMKAMSTNNDFPEQACRPFDDQRDGFVMSEGAGILFLEEFEHAKARGAKILGEIVGYGATTDAYHITTPDFKGAEKAMNLAIGMAGISPSDINYVNAHATGTKEGDKSETRAIKAVFKEAVSTLKVSATKSITGHLFGAAGGMEAIITLKSIEDGIIPPTLNLLNADAECDLDYVPNHAIEHTVNYAISNGFGFGGHNASLIFKKF